jgi:hypothetical protein
VQKLHRLMIGSREDPEGKTPHLESGAFKGADICGQTAEGKLWGEEESDDIRRHIMTAEREIKSSVIGLMPVKKGAF